MSARQPSARGAPVLVYAEFRFEAAHQLPAVPPEHMCARLHGHSYFVKVSVSGTVNAETGWVMDFGQLTAAVEPLRAALDHRCLNDIEGLSNPTSEHLAIWLWQRLQPAIRGLHSIEVQEMPGFGCIYRGTSLGRLD
jgi:6-pyruvoyltetrahydropterin/6-carboxytetrahydropterin synthase